MAVYTIADEAYEVTICKNYKELIEQVKKLEEQLT